MKAGSPSSSFNVDINVALPFLSLCRLVLSLTNISGYLRHNHQLASPLTSFANLNEGVYLFQNGIDPYSGGIFRHSPLYLSLFSTILGTSKYSSAILWTLADTAGAWALINIWWARQGIRSSQRDNLIAFCYLFNPYLCLPSLAFSTSSIENAVLLLAIMFACQKRSGASILCMAFSVHLSISTILFLLPTILLLLGDPNSHLASPQQRSIHTSRLLSHFGWFCVYTTALALVSTLITGSWSWVSQTWLASLILPDLTPNPGMWWYFFTEMFDHFRPFFLMVFSVHLLIYVLPICIKFQHDPLFSTFLIFGVLGIFKAYPTLSDPGLFLSLIPLFPEIYPHLKHPIVTTLLHLHASLLLPLFHHLWLYQGTGNANFFYASTLVFACANGAALVDCIWAGLRVAIGDVTDEYAVTQE